jgi:hypothetical protein
MSIVKDFYIENTRVVICDDYCRDKTPEDVNRILGRIAARALPVLQAAAGNTEVLCEKQTC